MPNFGFTSDELVSLSELKDNLLDEQDSINDSIEQILEETIPDLKVTESLFKKFYDLYENIIESIDEIARLSRGWVAYRVKDYPGEPYPNAGYEIQNACDYNYETLIFPHDWPYIYPKYSVDYGFIGWNNTAGMNEWASLLLEETELNRLSTFTPRNMPIIPSDEVPKSKSLIPGGGVPAGGVVPLAGPITAGKLNLDEQHTELTMEITEMTRTLSLINASGLSLTTLVNAINDFKVITTNDLAIVDHFRVDPYSITLADRKARITNRRTHINKFVSDITNTSVATLFDPRKHWMDCRINRAYGSLSIIYNTYSSLDILYYRRDMITRTIEGIRQVI